MSMIVHIDDNTDAKNSLSMLILDDALQILIQRGELDKENLANAIVQAKDELFELNKNNNDPLAKMQLAMIAHTLQNRYLELTQPTNGVFYDRQPNPNPRRLPPK